MAGKKPEKCIFCHPTDLLLFQTDDIIILLNKYPYNPAHLLIAPRKHVEKFQDLSNQDLLVLMKTIQKSIKLLEKVYSPTGFNVGLNQGKAAGASIIN
ncbi:MAG: HIT family protein, partial [Promethearchaeota archaeon]